MRRKRTTDERHAWNGRAGFRYTAAMNPTRIYDYLALSRERVMDAVRRLTPAAYRREFAFGLKTMGSTLTHIMIAEWYYIERLEGRTVPPYAEWPFQYERPPAFEVIDQTWREQAKRVRAAVAAEGDWNRTISYPSFPDDRGRRYYITATAGDFFTQLALHEVHHRAQVLAMLRELGDAATPVQDIDFNDMMYDRRELA